MTVLEDELREALSVLDRASASVALVGGLAVSVRAEPRLTRDADLAVSVADDGEAERVLADLGGRGYHVVTAVEHEPSGRLATARLSRHPTDRGVVLDLPFAAGLAQLRETTDWWPA